MSDYKNTVYITGHKNPDLDSLCSAFAYARLKNIISPENNYVAVRCGEISETVEKQLALAGVQAPGLMPDVYPKVKDVMLTTSSRTEVTEPVYHLIQEYNSENPSVTPLFKNGDYIGLLSVDDVTAWFLRDNMDANPEYYFTIENINKVLPGRILHQGLKQSFEAPINIGAASLEDFSEFVRHNSSSLIVMGARPDHIKCAISNNVPAIIITTINMEGTDTNVANALPAINAAGPDGKSIEKMPEIDFSDYGGLIYITSLSTAETIRRLRLCEPLSSLMKKRQVQLNINDLFTDAKDMFSSSNLRGFSVMNDGVFAGYVTRRCFLNKPSYNLILVDHNEPDQSIKGIETANIVEIIDHHRLDAMKTDLPILIDARPLGSTCTIVWQHYQAEGITPDPDSAKMLLTGILSDTLILKSPTTTQIDRKSVQELSEICHVDYKEFGSMLYSAASNLASTPPEKSITADFKAYENNGVKVGIGQCETTSLKNINEYIYPYLDELENVRERSGLDWALLMITDVLTENSILLSTIFKSGEKLPYEKLTEYNDPEVPGSKGCRAFDMPGVMSRKKQLLPAVLRTLE